MKIYRANAFTHSGLIAGKNVLGNPATVVLCTEMFPSRQEMSSIALAEKAPMTVFLQPHQDNIFDIEFYTPSGERFDLCGHGTLVAASVIYQIYGFEQVYFYKAINVADMETLVIKSWKESDFFKINMPAFHPVITKSFIVNYKKLLGIDNVEEVYLCSELNDIILVLKDAKVLRNATPLFKELAVMLSSQCIRGLFLTSPSCEPGFDYEVRIFAPHLGIEEDISCASANCSLVPLWHEKLGKIDGYEYKILCPYKSSGTGFGGIETGSYHSSKQNVFIGGKVDGHEKIKEHNYYTQKNYNTAENKAPHKNEGLYQN